MFIITVLFTFGMPALLAKHMAEAALDAGSKLEEFVPQMEDEHADIYHEHSHEDDESFSYEED